MAFLEYNLSLTIVKNDSPTIFFETPKKTVRASENSTFL